MSLNAESLSNYIRQKCYLNTYPTAQRNFWLAVKEYLEINTEFQGVYTGVISEPPYNPDPALFSSAKLIILGSGSNFIRYVDKKNSYSFLANELVQGLKEDVSSNQVILNSPLLGIGTLIPGSFNYIEADTTYPSNPFLKVSTEIVNFMKNSTILPIPTTSSTPGSGTTEIVKVF